MSLWVVFLGVLVFIIAFLFRILARVLGGALGGIIRVVFNIGMPIIAILLWGMSVSHEEGPQVGITVVSLIPLFLILIGFYIMTFGAFTTRDGFLWNVPMMLSIIIFILPLVEKGFLSNEQGGIFLLLFVLLLGVLTLLRPEEKKTGRRALTILLPLTLVILIFITGQGGWEFAAPLFFIIIIFLLLYRLLSSGKSGMQHRI